MLHDYFAPELGRRRSISSTVWFQQDGEFCHILRPTMAFSRQHLPGYRISLCGDVEWPPR